MISSFSFLFSDNDTDKLKNNLAAVRMPSIKIEIIFLKRQKNLARNSNPTRLILNVLTTLMPTLLLLSTASISPFVMKAYGEDGLDIDTVQYKVDKSGLIKAPEFTQIEEYINTDPLRISELKGKVILVHFWTYSCINCIHTSPK
jgi:hypothetical protein